MHPLSANTIYHVTNLRALSSDYSLKRHRSTCVEAKAAAAAKAVDTATSGADMRSDEWWARLISLKRF